MECAQSWNYQKFATCTYAESKLSNAGVGFLKVWPNETVLERETIWKTIICSDTGVTEQDVRRQEGKTLFYINIHTYIYKDRIGLLISTLFRVLEILHLVSHLLCWFPFQTYVNTTLYEKFTYAGIDCSAEEAAWDGTDLHSSVMDDRKPKFNQLKPKMWCAV